MVSRYLLLALLGTALARAQAPAANSSPPDAEKMMAAATQLVGQQHAWDEAAATSAAKLTFKEKSRKKTDQGTVITYDLFTAGLPLDQHYTLVYWPLNKPIEPVRGGISLTPEGRLVCTGKTPTDCPASKPGEDPIIDIALQFAKGEPKRYAIISDDQKFKAVASVVAFPIVSKDAGCSVEIRLGTPDAGVVLVTGSGFPPSTGVPVSSDAAGEVTQGVWQVNSKGDLISLLVPQVRGKNAGDSTVLLKSPACSPKISFHWGKGTYHVE